MWHQISPHSTIFIITTAVSEYECVRLCDVLFVCACVFVVTVITCYWRNFYDVYCHHYNYHYCRLHPNLSLLGAPLLYLNNWGLFLFVVIPPAECSKITSPTPHSPSNPLNQSINSQQHHNEELNSMRD